MNWTKGPWKYKSFDTIHELHIWDSVLRTVAKVPLSDDIERDIKIALLISKAPEMAELLEEISFHLGESRAYFKLHNMPTETKDRLSQLLAELKPKEETFDCGHAGPDPVCAQPGKRCTRHPEEK